LLRWPAFEWATPKSDPVLGVAITATRERIGSGLWKIAGNTKTTADQTQRGFNFLQGKPRKEYIG
jgi:hypothetical protein